MPRHSSQVFVTSVTPGIHALRVVVPCVSSICCTAILKIAGRTVSRSMKLRDLTLRSLACLAGIGLLVCLGVERGEQVARRGVASHPLWNIAGTQFAIADLDGDRKPDMASVEVETQQASWTSYAIRLQFSAGADAYIGVKGLFGGVRLAVRDVNGDDRLDLVLTSVIDRRVVQVLLNDGHGNFSPAEPDGNSAGPVDSGRSLSESQPSREDGTSSTISRWSFDEASLGVAVGDAAPDSALKIAETTARASGRTRLCHGRAPPSLPQLS